MNKQAMTSDLEKEIWQQPSTWKKSFQIIKQQRVQLEKMVEAYDKVVFLGAGTSEFIGNCLYRKLHESCHKTFVSISTTDFITNPSLYIEKEERLLMISFARSGNSPESLGSIHKANQISSCIQHVVITCNPNGALAKYEKAYCLLMPEETNDRSFAMTSSFTSMIIAAYAMFHLSFLEQVEQELSILCENAQQILDTYAPKLQQCIHEHEFERMAFLGTSSLKEFAQESALKTMELSAGKSVAIYNSFLGYRHGPVTFSYGERSTLMVYYINQDAKVHLYEQDMMAEIHQFKQKNYLLGLGKAHENTLKYVDAFLPLDCNINEVFYGIACVMIAQLLGMYQNEKLQLCKDVPFKNHECDGNATIYE